MKNEGERKIPRIITGAVMKKKYKLATKKKREAVGFGPAIKKNRFKKWKRRTDAQ